MRLSASFKRPVIDVAQGIDRPIVPPVSQMTQAAAYAASQQLPMPPLAPLEQQGSGFHVGQVMFPEICETLLWVA